MFNLCFLFSLTLHIVPYETWYNNLHQCTIWYVPVLFHMFSYAKKSYSAVLKVSEANVSLTSAAISFCFRIPFNTLNLLNCKLCLDCGTWVLHVCVIVDIWNPRSSRWKKPECFQLGGLKKKGKKIPLQPKMILLILKTLYHNQPYTTNISHLISNSLNTPSHSTSTHSLFACPFAHTPTHTPDSVPNHKFQQKTKTNWGNKSQH